MRNLTSENYMDVVNAIANEALEQDLNDRQRYIEESVQGSEWTFKPLLERIVMAFDLERGNQNESAYEAMYADVCYEIIERKEAIA